MNVNDPSTLSANDRQYYRRVWGFDPVSDCHQAGNTSFYEVAFPLSNDPALEAAGVTISARVNFGQEKDTRNQIVFKVGTHESSVTCVHMVVFKGRAEEALQWGEQARTPVSSEPVKLPPWEHFVALKSYVAGIAEVGILNLLKTSHLPREGSGNEILPFGFNSSMQRQVLQSLASVAPAAAIVLQRDWLMEVMERAPIEWLKKRQFLFLEICDISAIIADIRAKAGDWANANAAKLKVFDFDAALLKTSGLGPQIAMPREIIGVVPIPVPLRFRFDSLTFLILPDGAWRTGIDLPSARCALVTEYTMTLIPSGDGAGPVAYTEGIMPNGRVRIEVPVEREGTEIGGLGHIADELGQEHPRQDVNDYRDEHVQRVSDAVNRHLQGRQDDRQTFVEEVTNPSDRRVMTVTYQNPLRKYSLVYSITGFHVIIGDDHDRRRAGVEELETIVTLYLTREYLPRFLATINAMLAGARDYRDRHFTGLTIDSYRQPYARLLGDQIYQLDRDSLLDRPDITGCVIRVDTMVLPIPGAVMRTTQFGPEMGDGLDREARDGG